MAKRKLPPHPMQPMFNDGDSIRFRPNKIVRWLLDWGSSRGMNMNDLIALPFSASDREQFAQLIGYDFGGYGELPYVSSKSWAKAKAKYEKVKQATKKKGK